MGVRELKKELQKLKKEELIKHLVDVYKKYPEVKVYFDSLTTADISKILGLIFKTGLFDKFQDRAKQVVDDTSGIGWGFHDSLFEMYLEYYRSVD